MKRLLATACIAVAFAASVRAQSTSTAPTQAVGFVVRLGAWPPVVDLAGRVTTSPEEFERLTKSLERWSKPPLDGVPVSLAVSPALCDRLRSVGNKHARRLLDALRRLARRADVLTVPYADVWLPYLPSTRSVREQLSDGTSTLDACLGRRPIDVLFAHVLHTGDGEPVSDLDDEAVEAARKLGIESAVANGSLRTDVRSGLTLVPFRDSVPALNADGSLRDASRSAFAIIADATGDTEALQFHSIEAVATSAGVSVVPVRDLGRDAPMVTVAFPTDPPVAESYRKRVDRAENAVDAMVSVTLPENTLRTRLRAAHADALSVASNEAERALADLGERRNVSAPMADRITRFVDDQLELITISEGSVTFTSRRGSVPVTVSNKATYPVRVRVSVLSPKLEFPSGRTHVRTIEPPGGTITFAAIAKSSGAFPVTAVIKGPGGKLKIDETELTVRSAAANLPALILTAGGALFLLVVFGRRIGRRRKSGPA